MPCALSPLDNGTSSVQCWDPLHHLHYQAVFPGEYLLSKVTGLRGELALTCVYPTQVNWARQHNKASQKLSSSEKHTYMIDGCKAEPACYSRIMLNAPRNNPLHQKHPALSLSRQRFQGKVHEVVTSIFYSMAIVIYRIYTLHRI